MNTSNVYVSFPLTQNQTSIWLDEALFENNTLYNLGGYYEIKGELNIAAFIEAVRKVIGVHEIFGAAIDTIDGVPTQQFAPVVNYEMPYYDYSDQLEARANCIKKIEEDFAKPLVLSKSPLFDFSLYQIAEQHFFWSVKIHHILLDGWGLSLFLDQVSKNYLQLTKNPKLSIPTLPAFSNYIPKEQAYFQSEQFEEDKAYWLHKFKTLPSPIHTNPSSKYVQKLAQKSWFLPSELYAEMQVLATAQKVSMPQFWLSLLSVYFHKITANESICFGLPVLNRTSEEERQTLGLFVGVTPHLVETDATQHFEHILQQVKQNRRSDRPHQQLPLPQLMAALPQQAVENRGLFEVVISFDQHSYALPIKDLESKFTFLRAGQEKMPLTLYVRKAAADGQVELSFEFLENYYDEIAIDRMIARLHELVINLLAHPQKAIGEINYLPEAERTLLLEKFNNTKRDFPVNGSIVTSFEEQAEKRPQQKALVYRESTWTYEALNKKANEVAHYLIQQHDIQPNDIIALQMQRSDQMIATILGVLKAGACYLPLAKDLPAKRSEYILEESQAKLIICDEIELQFSNCQQLSLLTYNSIQHENEDNPRLAISAENLAYVMFTSGSTGMPKGVCISHRNVLRLVKNSKFAKMDASQTFLHLAQVAFDASTFEIWGALLNGGQLVVIPHEQASLEQIKTVIQQYRVSTLWLTAGLFHLMVEHGLEGLDSLQQVLAGGDVLSATHIKKAIAALPECDFINGYGPTENTTFTTTCRLNDLVEIGASVPIGKPISNTEVYILDEAQKLCPIGVKGELYAGGAGLASAYLNNPELTAEKFIAHPFKAGEKLYRTGDLAAWQANGNIEFLGRKDFQLKIRGFRIETAEIEQALLEHPEISNAVVLGRAMEQGKELVAYFISHNNNIESSELRTFLTQHLPKYMLPSYFIRMDNFPLNASGKVDRKALPLPNMKAALNNYISPQTDLEKSLVTLWEEVLNTEKIGLSDHFFELGGHSLRAVKLVAKMQEVLGIEVRVSEIFSHPTIEQLSALLTTRTQTKLLSIPKVKEQFSYDISHAQARLWMLDQFEQNQKAYNMPFAIRIHGEIEVSYLEKAFQLLINRHEILRTNFIQEDGKAMQLIRSKDQFRLDCKLLVDASEEELIAYVKTYAAHSFDLTKEELIQVQLVKVGYQDYLLLVNMHHIISDGWSNGILFQELEQYYNAVLQKDSLDLPELPIQYKDFAAWQNQQLSEKAIVEPLHAYWNNKLEGTKPLELPTDFPRPSVKCFEGESLNFVFSKKQLAQLEQLGKTVDATLFMTLTTLVKILLYRYTGQKDICIGTPSSGRTHTDLQNQIGFYVNTLALRDELDAQASFTSNLAAIKTTALEAFERELYPFDCIVEDLGGARDRSRSPLFDVMVVLQNNEQYDLQLGNAEIEMKMIETASSKFDLTFCFSSGKEGLKMNIEYSTSLFKSSRIQRMATHFEELLEAVVENKEQAIGQLNILGVQEQQALYYDFNATTAVFPTQKTVVQLIEEQVTKTPERIALKFGTHQLTYEEFNALGNQVAHGLNARFEIKPNDVIALQAERGIEMMIAILGILKTGAAYLPISADFPKNRLQYILEDSQAKLLLRGDACIQKLGKELVDLPVLGINSIADGQIQNPKTKMQPKDLAYIIYTSGSTGKPKGVAITNRSMLNYLHWANGFYFDHTSDFDLPLHASIAFDMSITTLFSPLLRGAAIQICPEQEAASNLANIFHPNSTLKAVKLTPSHIDMLAMLDLEETGIQKVIVGGEALQERQLQTLFRLNPNMEVYNEYGPTEATVGCIVKTLTSAEQGITIGSPIANTQIHILDQNGQIAPIGVVGEICISGASLAAGYLNKVELSTEKFIDTPFATKGRMYKTGDLGYWLENGEIQYLGRIDHQVKVRGYRIETGEIEEVLLADEAIQNAVVQIQYKGQDATLVAYLLKKKSTSDFDLTKLKIALAEELPNYMIPNHFVCLDQFPLTQSGKIDRKALLTLEIENTDVEIALPTSDTEQQLLGIWQEVLELEQISVEDDFFQIGGHSLKAIRLISLIRQKMELQLPVQTLFQHTSIRALAKQIDTLKTYNTSYLPTEIGTRFNVSASTPIFAFPPFLGLGIGFQQLAKHLPAYTFYCFDFLEGEDLLERYYQQIKKEQPKGAYTILGYSAGGNLAYEMVAYLEAKGEEVAALIFIDSAVWPQVPLSYVDRFFNKLDNRLERGHTELDESFKNFLQNKTIRAQTTQRLLAYRSFLNKIEMEHCLKTNMYQIVADITDVEMEGRLQWKSYTTGNFEVYRGVGEHEEMCAEPYVLQNAKLLKEVLQSATRKQKSAFFLEKPAFL